MLSNIRQAVCRRAALPACASPSFSHGAPAPPSNQQPQPNTDAANHANVLKEHQEDLGYDPETPATEQNKTLQSGVGMASMQGNLYDREGMRYQLKAEEQETKAPPSTGYDEEATGDVERAHQHAREAAAMVGMGDGEDAAVKDTGT